MLEIVETVRYKMFNKIKEPNNTLNMSHMSIKQDNRSLMTVLYFSLCVSGGASEPDVDFTACALTARNALIAISIGQEAAARGNSGRVVLQGRDSLF